MFLFIVLLLYFLLLPFLSTIIERGVNLLLFYILSPSYYYYRHNLNPTSAKALQKNLPVNFDLSISVQRCISELRERVARGGDPTKLHEPPVEEVAPDSEQGNIRLYLRVFDSSIQERVLC